MADFGFLSGKDDSAVDNLISQAKDLYVLEQVAAINCCRFTDSALPTNLETRFRRLKSLPVSRPDPVSSSKKLLSHSKSFCGNASPASSAFSGDVKNSFSGNPTGKYRPLGSSVEDTRIFPGIKSNPSVNSRGGLEDFSDSLKIDSRFSREGKLFSPTTQTLKLLPKEKHRISSSSFTSIDLTSPSSDLNRTEERSNRKSKSKLSTISWFEKLLPSQAMGCLWLSPTKSSPNSKKTKKSSNNKELSVDEQLKKAKKSFKEATSRADGSI